MADTSTQTSDLVVRGIPAVLHRQLKVSAAASGISVKELVISLLQKHVSPGGTFHVQLSGGATPATDQTETPTRVATLVETLPHGEEPGD